VPCEQSYLNVRSIESLSLRFVSLAGSRAVGLSCGMVHRAPLSLVFLVFLLGCADARQEVRTPYPSLLPMTELFGETTSPPPAVQSLEARAALLRARARALRG